VGVGAVVVHAGKVLLVKRGKPPLRGRWTVPGGTVELGETLERALVREIFEETGLVVRPRGPLGIFDKIRHESGRVRYHYVIVDFLCDYVSGAARAGSDARELAFVSPEELPAYRLAGAALRVVLEGLRRAGVSAFAPSVRRPVASRVRGR
jgi:ADP-ribose pyrophosphatase YjhB (NUDIX family)